MARTDLAKEALAKAVQAVSDRVEASVRAGQYLRTETSGADDVMLLLNRVASELRSQDYASDQAIWRKIARRAPQFGGVADIASARRLLCDPGSELVRGLRAHEPVTTDRFRRLVRQVREAVGAREGNTKLCVPWEVHTKESEELLQLRNQLSNYFPRRWPELADRGESVVLGARRLEGGGGKLTALVRLAPNGALPSTMVLRADPAVPYKSTSVADEYLVLSQLWDAGVPVPRPIWLEEQATDIAPRFLLVAYVEGTQAGQPQRFGYLHPDVGPAFARQVAAVLAQIHACTRVSLSDSQRDAFSHPLAVLERHCAAESEDGGGFALASPVVALSYCWLLAHAEVLPDRPTSLVHGDFGVHNLLTHNGRLSAVVDWELAHAGDPAEDVGYCWRLYMEDLISLDEFTEIYVANGGNPAACDRGVMAYYGLLGTARVRAWLVEKQAQVMVESHAELPTYISALDVARRMDLLTLKELECAADVFRSSVSG